MGNKIELAWRKNLTVIFQLLILYTGFVVLVLGFTTVFCYCLGAILLLALIYELIDLFSTQ